MTEGEFDIPSFLRLTEEQRKRAREATPIVKSIETEKWKELELKRAERIKAAKRENNKKSSLVRANKELAKDAAKMQSADSEGKIWVDGRWRDPSLMSRARYLRILSELPTEKHRQLFVSEYANKVIGGAPRVKKQAA